MPQRLKRTVLCLIAVVASACLLHADPFFIGGAPYFADGPSEIVSVTFSQSNGGATIHQYQGFVLLSSAGTGQSLGTQRNDAFYIYTDSAGNSITPQNNTSHYQLAIDTKPLVGSYGNPTPVVHNARNNIVYDVATGSQVTPPYVPAYNDSHEYQFIVDVAGLESNINGLNTLYFGINDGEFRDNFGTLEISVQRLAPVPEPSSIALLGAAIALAFGVRRIRRV